MQRDRLALIGILVLQIVAVILYPPAFFQRAPQAIVLPPAFLILFVLALIGMNTGVLTPTAGRSSLVFVQGVNIVVRLMMLFANLKTPAGDWDVTLIVLLLVAIALSWATILWMEKRQPRFLLLRQQSMG
ncbi:MAG TPA: hypothetical protein G4O00_04635 [Thermoflexia bacterium]|nr:hypothetical protein [Thermoflexia bacterium]